MADATLKIVIDAINKADKIFKTLKEDLKGVEGNGAKAKVAMDILKAALGVTGVAGAVGLVGRAVRKSVLEWSAYAESVENAARLSGVTSEEMSRLIQASDDFRVSQGSLTTAMNMALKNGFIPTIANLAKLSDEFIAMKDPAQRAEMASKIFGRQWAEIEPLLRQGGDAIRNGTAAIADNLVVTEEAVRENKKFIQTLDNYQDAWTGLSHTVGQEVLPVLTAAMQAATEGDNLWEFIKRLREETKETDPVIAAMTGRLDAQYQAYLNATAAAEGNADVTEVLTARQKAYIQAVKDGRIDVQHYTDELGNELRTMDELSLFMAGPLGNETENFNLKQKELALSAQDVQTEIDKLESKRYLTNAQKETLAELKTELGNIKDQVRANADAHEEATKRILFGMMQQQMAADGLSQKEQDVLWEISKNWGLIDQATYDAWMQMKNYTGAIDDAALPADILARKIALLQDKHVWITTTYVEEYVKALQTGAGEPIVRSGDQTQFDRATGGPVMTGQTYNWQEHGYPGEIFVPSMDGFVLSRSEAKQILSQAAQGNGQTRGGDININVTGAADPWQTAHLIDLNFRAAQALAGVA